MTNQTSQQDQTRMMLKHLGIPVHLSGYRSLIVSVPKYAEDPEQSITKEIYPYAARQLHTNTMKIESSTRRAIHYGFLHGDPEVWAEYFPYFEKAPSNMVFIATLADRLK